MNIPLHFSRAWAEQEYEAAKVDCKTVLMQPIGSPYWRDQYRQAADRRDAALELVMAAKFNLKGELS